MIEKQDETIKYLRKFTENKKDLHLLQQMKIRCNHFRMEEMVTESLNYYSISSFQVQ